MSHWIKAISWRPTPGAYASDMGDIKKAAGHATWNRKLKIIKLSTLRRFVNRLFTNRQLVNRQLVNLNNTLSISQPVSSATVTWSTALFGQPVKEERHLVNQENKSIILSTSFPEYN